LCHEAAQGGLLRRLPPLLLLRVLRVSVGVVLQDVEGARAEPARQPRRGGVY
jgi:hypothetical protein